MFLLTRMLLGIQMCVMESCSAPLEMNDLKRDKRGLLPCCMLVKVPELLGLFVAAGTIGRII